MFMQPKFIQQSLEILVSARAQHGKLKYCSKLLILKLQSLMVSKYFFEKLQNLVLYFSARVGGILCPYLNMVADYWRPGPLIVYGGLAFLAGIFSLLLPLLKRYSKSSSVTGASPTICLASFRTAFLCYHEIFLF